MLQSALPLVDLSDFTEGGAAAERFVACFGDALAEFGFVAVTGHGVPPELVAQAYAAAWQVFALPGRVKHSYETRGLHGQRGFVGPGREWAKGAAVPDRKEFWHVGREGDWPANVWPEEVPEFRPVL